MTARRTSQADEANPATMPDAGLLCAVAACENSTHLTDRKFAKACREELKRRLNVPAWTHPPERHAA